MHILAVSSRQEGLGGTLPHTSCASFMLLSVQGNNFPIIFREAAQAAQCKIDYDGFDTCVGMVSNDMIQGSEYREGMIGADLNHAMMPAKV